MDCAELTISRTFDGVMASVMRERRLIPWTPPAGSDNASRNAARMFALGRVRDFSSGASSDPRESRCLEVMFDVATTGGSFAPAVDAAGSDEIEWPTRMPAMKIPPPAMRYFQRPSGDLIMIYFP